MTEQLFPIKWTAAGSVDVTAPDREAAMKIAAGMLICGSIDGELLELGPRPCLPKTVGFRSVGTLIVDGILPGTDSLAGDGTEPPFFLFDSQKQENVAGPFGTMAEALLALDKLAIAESHFCSVWRSADGYDCTNKGESSKYKDAWLYREFPGLARISELHERGIGAYLLAPPRIPGNPPRAIPAMPGSRRPMFGGNFLWTSDSTFRRQVCEHPLPIHDRFE